jgi:putative acyl-CoA dehydrogenase
VLLVQYDGAIGYLLGPRGAGVATIMEMVVHTRLDCALGSAGLMRQATRAALHYASLRHAFGTALIEAPAMQVWAM